MPKGHRPVKALGQHFLRDPAYAERAADAADVGPEDVVLEIGPGQGVLTRVLAPRAREVVAVELDAHLAADMRAQAPGNVRIVHGDAVDVPFPAFDACVSNLPYQVSSPILFKLLRHPGWRVAVLMVQKEFADRLVAAPGTKAYGRLTVGAAYRADVTRVARVPRGAFDPPPRVESALVKLVPRPPAFHVEDEALFHDVVLAAFTQRRKTLANALRHAGHLVTADTARLADAAADVPFAGTRADAIPPAGFGDVANALTAAGFRGRDA